MLVVALLPSNQDRNLGAIAGYSEAGGCAQIVARVEPLLRQAGAIARTFSAPLESADDAQHTALKRTMREARLWLESAPALARKAAVHIHTNAGSTPEVGSSHTGYCYGSPEGAALGKLIANCVSAVLGLPVVAYDYTGQQYLFDVLFAPLPSCLLEVTRHDRLQDLQTLYAQVDRVASAVVAGLLAWAGLPQGQDEVANLRAENERLRAALARCRDSLQAAGF